MIVKRCFEPKLAQASYLIGCAVTHECLVIDPNRDAEQYMKMAEAEGLRIVGITETHIHADYLSGSRELAARTGATLYVSDEGDADWKYAFAGDKGVKTIKDGDRLTVGNVKIDVLHTPGHTPEHLSFLVTDGAAADEPIAAATGDFIFVGDVGRPDLLERAANIKGTMESGAGGRTGCSCGRDTGLDRRAAKASAPFRTARWAMRSASTGRFRPATKRHSSRACWPGSRIRRSTLLK
jgi:hydroxyacylglutathione hydrolase